VTKAARFLQLAAAALMLAGCTPTSAVRTQIQEVSVPVAVYPIDPARIPSAPAPLPPRPASPSAVADTLLAKWCEAVAFIMVANPLLQAGAGIPVTAAVIYPECERQR